MDQFLVCCRLFPTSLQRFSGSKRVFDAKLGVFHSSITVLLIMDYSVEHKPFHSQSVSY